MAEIVGQLPWFGLEALFDTNGCGTMVWSVSVTVFVSEILSFRMQTHPKAYL